jgi:hypothetical protein
MQDEKKRNENDIVARQRRTGVPLSSASQEDVSENEGLRDVSFVFILVFNER